MRSTIRMIVCVVSSVLVINKIQGLQLKAVNSWKSYGLSLSDINHQKTIIGPILTTTKARVNPLFALRSFDGSATSVAGQQRINKQNSPLRLRLLLLEIYQKALMQKVYWRQSMARRWRSKMISVLMSFVLLFSTLETPITGSHNVHVHATTSVPSATMPNKQRLTYEDKLVQKYIEKHMFRDDVYDPFESVYKEIIQDEVTGAKPIESLQDFGEDVPKIKNQPTRVPKKRPIGSSAKPKKRTKAPFYWNTLMNSHRPFTEFLRKTLNISSKRAATISIAVLMVAPMAIILYGCQAAWATFRTMTVKREGERYGGRE